MHISSTIERNRTLYVNTHEELQLLTAKIKAIIGGISSPHRISLEDARSVAEILAQGKTICIPDRVGVQPPMTWTAWLGSMEIHRQVAHDYLLIHKYWEQVKKLDKKERSIRGAIRLIRIINPPKPRPKKITLKATTVMIAAKASGLELGREVTLVELENFLNRIMDQVGIKKHVRVDSEEDMVTSEMK
jgi:hypothetical protein